MDIPPLQQVAPTSVSFGFVLHIRGGKGGGAPVATIYYAYMHAHQQASRAGLSHGAVGAPDLSAMLFTCS